MSQPADIRANPRKPSLPDGPPHVFLRILTRRIFGTANRQTPADFLRAVAQEHGDLTYYRIAGKDSYQIYHPDLIADLFGKDSVHHHRNVVMQRSRDVLGHGLVTSEEPLHMRQRRLMQPAFLRSRIASYAEVITAKTMDLTAEWTQKAAAGGTIDMHPQMLELALRIVGKCLFDLDEVADLHAMESAVSSFQLFLPLTFLPFSRAVQASPLPAMRKLRRGQQFLDTLIYRIIAERRADPRSGGSADATFDRGDLLSMLLNATEMDAAGKSSNAAAMSDKQLRDECVTIMLAGHETTANALSFAVHLLAHHPDVQERLHAEAVAVLGGRLPTADDVPQLRYARQVFAETMRLYPPVWTTSREVAEPYQIAGFTLPKGAIVNAPQYAVHRDERWWPEPDRFDPDRFAATSPDDAKSMRPKYAYFPFGGGSRQCIAEGLAWMEGTLALAIIARDWRLTPLPGSKEKIEVAPLITLRPKHGVRLRVERR